MNLRPQNGFELRENVPLAAYTTLRIGGPARYFAEVHTVEELLEAVAFARERSVPIFVLGGGSNLVVSDAGFPGLVIHMALSGDIAWTADRTYMEVSAGFDWDALVKIVCEQGMSGIECLAGIPGLVGASPIQNIGAYGQEVATSISSVQALDLHALELQAGRPDRTPVVELPAAACRFGYRSSIFNSTERGRYIITRVDFSFDPAARPNLSYADLAPLRGQNPTPLEVYHAVRAIRDRKAMVIHPGADDPDTRSAGSFFKNPVVGREVLEAISAASAPLPVPNWPAGEGSVKLAAAWLIEQAGFPKGFVLGGAGISTRHTLALTNRSGEASCDDLMRLRDAIVGGVQERFGVRLEQEPVFLG